VHISKLGQLGAPKTSASLETIFLLMIMATVLADFAFPVLKRSV